MQHYPNEQSASEIFTSMTNLLVHEIKRLTTGDQHFVYEIKTTQKDYVIRLTTPEQKNKFIAALYWQEKFLPLNIPLAQFINVDLEKKYSQFPALLMNRLPGDDLVNVYHSLNNNDKKNLAIEMIQIQEKVMALPKGSRYGLASSYNNAETNSWYSFIMGRLETFKEIIVKNGVFDPAMIIKVSNIAIKMKQELEAIPATPFLWDASERNVLVHKGKITGIVDIGEICFGDPLFVIALTSIALQLENLDTIYTDYWTELLNLAPNEKKRLDFYKIFYVIVFMRKHNITTANAKIVQFSTCKLNTLFENTYQLL